MKTRKRVRVLAIGALLVALTASTTAFATEPGDEPSTPVLTLQQQIDSLLNPSEGLRSAQEQLVDLAEKAESAAGTAAQAEVARLESAAAETQALADAAEASARAEDARVRLGDYAASAYISGGSNAGVAATLSSGTPTEMVARQNTLTAVADNSTDLVRVLRDAQTKADAAKRSAQSAAAAAKAAKDVAQQAASVATTAASDAQALLEGLVATEVEAQTQAMAEAALRARVAAYSVGAGSGIVDAKGDPIAYQVFGNGKIPREFLSAVGDTGHYLWPPAARALETLIADAAAQGITIGITDSYRTYESQVDVAERKGLYSAGGLAATPGSSDHGWGTAVDLALNASAQAWIRAHGATYGFVEDTPREAWHWHFTPFA